MSLQSLSDPALRSLQVVELSLLPGRLGEPAAHAGEEWVYVLSGAIEVDVNGNASSLAAGDVIHFRADMTHALRNPHEKVATVLVVNALEAPALHPGHRPQRSGRQSMTRVAVVQAASIPFDSAATVAKAEGLIAECAAGGAQLAVFPEAFIGCYPKGSAFGAVVGSRSGPGRDLYQRYFDAAVQLDGADVGPLISASAAHAIFVVVGVIERFGSTLYCTALMIDPVAGLAGIHRKLMPTGTERLIWGFGDGSTIGTAQSSAGRVGTVICWENYMPALRQAMYAQGVELYCAPTADDRPTWMATMTHIALEGRVFVLTACQAIRASAFPDWYQSG